MHYQENTNFPQKKVRNKNGFQILNHIFTIKPTNVFGDFITTLKINGRNGGTVYVLLRIGSETKMF